MTESKKESREAQATEPARPSEKKVDLQEFLERMNRDFRKTLAHLAK